VGTGTLSLYSRLGPAGSNIWPQPSTLYAVVHVVSSICVLFLLIYIVRNVFPDLAHFAQNP
jgi:hypothetical protein